MIAAATLYSFSNTSEVSKSLIAFKFKCGCVTLVSMLL